MKFSKLSRSYNNASEPTNDDNFHFHRIIKKNCLFRFVASAVFLAGIVGGVRTTIVLISIISRIVTHSHSVYRSTPTKRDLYDRFDSFIDYAFALVHSSTQRTCMERCIERLKSQPRIERIAFRGACSPTFCLSSSVRFIVCTVHVREPMELRGRKSSIRRSTDLWLA